MTIIATTTQHYLYEDDLPILSIMDSTLILKSEKLWEIFTQKGNTPNEVGLGFLPSVKGLFSYEGEVIFNTNNIVSLGKAKENSQFMETFLRARKSNEN